MKNPFAYLRERNISAAAKKIPQRVFELLDLIRSRYSKIDFAIVEFEGLPEKEKLKLFIRQINLDLLLKELSNFTSNTSLIMTRRLARLDVDENVPEGTRGFGIDLCFDENGLLIYEWSDCRDYSSLSRDVPTILKVLREQSWDCERLRQAIVAYTEKENYIRRVEKFKMFLM